MLDLMLFVIATAMGGAGEPGGEAESILRAQSAALEPEAQVPSGQFTTALEVRPILTATRAGWVAVRDYGGQDLVYVTQLMAWRCGLVRMRVGINGGPLDDWPLPPCHEGTASPNALTEADGAPYRAFAAGSVTQVEVEITYDDLGTDRESYARAAVLMP